MRKSITVALAATVLMLVSLLYQRHIFQIDYEAYNYGFPLAWLVHYVEGISPVNLWYPDGFGVLLDMAFWLSISIAMISMVSLLRRRPQPSISRK